MRAAPGLPRHQVLTPEQLHDASVYDLLGRPVARLPIDVGATAEQLQLALLGRPAGLYVVAARDAAGRPTTRTYFHHAR